MTLPEDRLTAYALNDPGLTAAERTVIEEHLTADPAARQAVEETRQLGALLTTSLSREQVTLTADVAPTPAKPARRWPAYVGGLASGVALTLAVAVGVTTLDVRFDSKPMTQAAAPAAMSEAAPEVLSTTTGIDPDPAVLDDTARSTPNDSASAAKGETASAKNDHRTPMMPPPPPAKPAVVSTPPGASPFAPLSSVSPQGGIGGFGGGQPGFPGTQPQGGFSGAQPGVAGTGQQGGFGGGIGGGLGAPGEPPAGRWLLPLAIRVRPAPHR